MSKITSNIPHILERIASLTAIHDMALFEQSFIKILAELLTAKNICLYKSNNFETACHRIRYTSTEDQQTDFFNEASFELITEKIDVPVELIEAQDWIKSTHRFYSVRLNTIFFMVYPIIGLKGIVGYLSLELPHKLTKTEIQVITNLLHISHNFYSLLEENQKDKLTGLLNRKTFDTNISKIKDILITENDDHSFSGAEKRHDHDTQSGKFWLAIMDIDHFKRVNDTFGHVYGDEVLLLLSQVMKKTFRTKDLLFRFGGEEFVTILQVEHKQIAEHILTRFRKAIEAFIFPQVGTVTISIGATQILEQRSIASEIVGRADQALYYAKEKGRNRLFFYEALIDQGLLKSNVAEGDIELF